MERRRNIAIDLRDLVSVEELCDNGEIPVSYARAKGFCRRKGKSNAMLPAFKLSGKWYTTREAVRIWIFSMSNYALREFSSEFAERSDIPPDERFTIPGESIDFGHRLVPLKSVCGTASLPISYRVARL